MDPLGGACAAAAVTNRVKIGTCVVQAPLRQPVEFAQCILSTHLMSEGRFRFALGAGSTEGDFNAVGVHFADRFKLLKESLASMQALWRGETVDGVNLTPWKAAVGGPPILIGSWAGSRWLPIAAEQYDGWIGSAMYINSVALKKTVLIGLIGSAANGPSSRIFRLSLALHSSHQPFYFGSVNHGFGSIQDVQNLVNSFCIADLSQIWPK